jgi:hypothetical protein
MRTTPMKTARVLFVLACIFVVGALTSTGASVAMAAPSARSLAGRLHLHKRALATGRSAPRPHWVCPEGACEAIALPPPTRTAHGFALPLTHRLLEGSGELGGYDPADLQSAYNIPTGGGSGRTVALIDA